jgi:hypothetical protein
MATTPSTRNAPLAVTVVLTVLGLALITVAVIYLTRTAAQLPTFFPGHQAGSSHHHTKHGIATLAVGLIAWTAAWISAGKKPSR